MKNIMGWYVYQIFPTDFGWEFLRTINQTAAVMNDSFMEKMKDCGLFAETIIGDEFPDNDAVELIMDFNISKELATENGWEGDFRGSAYVFWIPDEHNMRYGFVWKQDNNGTTFVVSPVPLPHLKDIR